MNPIFFASGDEFRTWLEENHDKENEIIVGYYKISTQKPSLTWSESVDQALCFGWIDGIRRSVDSESYCIRFTPRRKTSLWSDINIKKVEELTKKGLMKQAGLDAYACRKIDNSRTNNSNKVSEKFDSTFEKLFKENKIAWDYFTMQAPSYQKNIQRWIMAAKQETTQLSRLQKAITESEKQKRLF